MESFCFAKEGFAFQIVGQDPGSPKREGAMPTFPPEGARIHPPNLDVSGGRHCKTPRNPRGRTAPGREGFGFLPRSDPGGAPPPHFIRGGMPAHWRGLAPPGALWREAFKWSRPLRGGGLPRRACCQTKNSGRDWGCQQVPTAPVRLKEAQSIPPSNQEEWIESGRPFPSTRGEAEDPFRQRRKDMPTRIADSTCSFSEARHDGVSPRRSPSTHLAPETPQWLPSRNPDDPGPHNNPLISFGDFIFPHFIRGEFDWRGRPLKLQGLVRLQIKKVFLKDRPRGESTPSDKTPNEGVLHLLCQCCPERYEATPPPAFFFARVKPVLPFGFGGLWRESPPSRHLAIGGGKPSRKRGLTTYKTPTTEELIQQVGGEATLKKENANVSGGHIVLQKAKRRPCPPSPEGIPPTSPFSSNNPE
ncbi:hypothetical protein RRG08_057348 [Elysia crispata]|uniref:Uncharacterized protein n=1 Tax=Elysia crispata TaxID=231223 RepID=A0AAE0YKB0_9GAST|nr:hypothetical protein RRG08_057348 [Elysia crispata]